LAGLQDKLDHLLIDADNQLGQWEETHDPIMNELDLAYFLGERINAEGLKVHYDADLGTHFPNIKE
jgi:hypothetical protein